MPARPFLHLTEDDVEKMESTAEQYLKTYFRLRQFVCKLCDAFSLIVLE